MFHVERSMLPVPVFLFLVTLLCIGFSCQSGALRAPVSGTWIPSGPNTYRFADDHLEVLLVMETDRTLSWEFKNRMWSSLEIRHQEVALCLLDESHQPIDKFTLWGAPIESADQYPPIRVSPRSFVAFRYPVLFRSPLIPFENVRQRVELRFFARWGKKITPYRVIFMAQGTTP